MKRLSLLAVAIAALLSACGDDPPARAAPAKKPKAATGAAAAAAKPAEPAAADAASPLPPYLYAYNPLGKRDPFRSYVAEQKAGDDATAPCLEPLCQWDLEQLGLVAVVSGEANPLAMLEDPSKTGHLVRRNTRVGKQGGKVTQILRDCIVVTEYWQGPDGKINPNPVKVCIKEDKQTKNFVDLMNPQKRYP